MPDPGPAARLMILMDEDRTWNHKPLVDEIIRRAHDAGLAGASAFRGVEGFGASQLVHTSRILDLSDKLPMMVLIIDTHERVEQFLPQLAELEIGGVITVDDVEIVGHEVAGAGAR
jgi:PII-like signaling protein